MPLVQHFSIDIQSLKIYQSGWAMLGEASSIPAPGEGRKQSEQALQIFNHVWTNKDQTGGPGRPIIDGKVEKRSGNLAG